MKKVLLTLCVSALSVCAFAKNSSAVSVNVANTANSTNKASMFLVENTRITDTYTSSCGVKWSLTAHGSNIADASIRLANLMDACDAACGTKTTQILM